MAKVLFKCPTTSFRTTLDENEINTFSIYNESLVINLIDEEDEIIETEISKEDAIKLAKLILFTYAL
jgi:hypothetical protein